MSTLLRLLRGDNRHVTREARTRQFLSIYLSGAREDRVTQRCKGVSRVDRRLPAFAVTCDFANQGGHACMRVNVLVELRA